MNSPAREIDAERALIDIKAERRRQFAVENWSPAHDDGHTRGELALAAALYAIPYEGGLVDQEDFFGLHMALEIRAAWTLKPEADLRRRLVKAAALLVAEIERLDRSAQP